MLSGRHGRPFDPTPRDALIGRGSPCNLAGKVPKVTKVGNSWAAGLLGKPAGLGRRGEKRTTLGRLAIYHTWLVLTAVAL